MAEGSGDCGEAIAVVGVVEVGRWLTVLVTPALARARSTPAATPAGLVLEDDVPFLVMGDRSRPGRDRRVDPPRERPRRRLSRCLPMRPVPQGPPAESWPRSGRASSPSP